jgi:O-antigen/teichoic acid export membrane protein
MVIVTPATIVIAAGGMLILDIFGRQYASAGYGLLIVLLLSSFPDAVTNIAVATLRVRRRLAAAAALNGFMALISVGGAWIVAPRLGIVGAGLAWLGAQSAGALVVVLLRRDLWPPKDAAPVASDTSVTPATSDTPVTSDTDARAVSAAITEGSR